MSAPYQIIDLPGKSGFKLTTVTRDESNGPNIQSPEWMINIANLTKSNIDGYKNYTEVFGWHGEASRISTSNASGSFTSPGTLKHSELIVLIPYDGYAAEIENYMNKGQIVDKVTIVRVGFINQSKVKLQEVVYTLCRLQRLEQQLDRLLVALSVTTKKNTIYVYNQAGMLQGSNISNVDYIKNSSQI
jgi:hypothetical protein